MVTPPPSPPPPVGGQDQYTEFLAQGAVDLAKEGARLHDSHEMVAGYKRKRDEQSAPPVLGTAHVQQQQQQKTIVVNDALAEQTKKRIMLIDPAAVERVLKRLKEKDEEILHITGQNWSLRERVIYFHKAAQMWHDVALSKEATANAPRGDLQRALDAHAVPGRGVEDVDDASSCCSGDNQYGGRKPAEAAASVGRCKGCGNGEAVELLLPCRHLCVCSPCATTARACPACGCAKNGSINVNFS